MRISILMILYILEVMKYYLAYYLCYGAKKIKYFVPLLGGVMCFLLILFGQSSENILAYICLTVLIVMLFSLNGEKRVSKLLILFFILNSLDECVSMIGRALVWGPNSCGLERMVEQFWESLIGLLIILFAIFIDRRIGISKREKIGNFVKKNIFIVAIIMAVCMLFTVAELEYARHEITDNGRFYNISFVLCLVSYISIGLVGFFAIYIKMVNEQMEQMVENEILLKKMQKHYYEELLGKEEDTRRYRHDMNNHLICLRNYASNGDLEKVLEYVEKMQGAASEIQKRCYFSGNEIIDAITNYYVPQLTDEVAVSVSGKMQIDVDEMGLCTIYANLLQNAVEELGRGEGKKGFLNIHFYQGVKYLRISIENSLSETQTKQELENMLKTKKKDTLNHGIGLRNVKKVVEEMGGMLEVRKNEESFLAEVNLPAEK